MKNFNPLTFYSQDELSQALNESAQSIGGKNYSEETAKEIFDKVSEEFEGINWKSKKTEQDKMLAEIKKPLWLKLKMDIKSAENIAKTIFNLMFSIR